MKIIHRGPDDEFTFDLLNQLITGVDCECYYTHSMHDQDLTELLTQQAFDKSLVVIGIKDLMDFWNQDFDFWNRDQQAVTQLLDRCVRNNPDRRFIVFTSTENLDLEISQPNLFIVPWGGDWTNQHVAHSRLEPVLQKNFSSKKHFICLNRHTRTHRVVLLSYLFGRGLDQHGVISFLNSVDPNANSLSSDFLEQVPWMFDHPRHDRIKHCLIQGYSRIHNNPALALDDYQVYPEKLDNVYLFNSLRPRFQDSFLQIITESSFSAPAYMLTEKTLHSFFACNFPILISGNGAVEHLRELGFDMFDDIVDHSYDLIKNPIDRLTRAVDDNAHLLTQGDLVKQHWKNSQDRFRHNVEVARNITTYYRQRAQELWARIPKND